MNDTLTTILLPTLERLRALYASGSASPGHVTSILLKPGWNVVCGSDGQHGAAMNFDGIESGATTPDEALLRSWIGLPLIHVALLALRRQHWCERAIGVAALSAMSQPFLMPGSLASRGIEISPDDFASRLRPTDVVALVGYGGMVPRLVGRCRELHVTDMRPRRAFQTLVVERESTGFAPADVTVHAPEDNADVLGRADAVAITGSTLVNGTCGDLLACCRRARLVAVYGASAGFIPDVLFDQGVHMVQAHRVSDPGSFEQGMRDEMQLEPVIRRTQTFQTLVRRA